MYIALGWIDRGEVISSNVSSTSSSFFDQSSAGSLPTDLTIFVSATIGIVVGIKEISSNVNSTLIMCRRHRYRRRPLNCISR